MLADSVCSESLENSTQGLLPKRFTVLATAGGVTVLALLLGCDVVHGNAIARCDLRISEFACEFQLPVGAGRLEGRMASDGLRHRVAIYWIEPDVFREAASFVRYADLLFASGMAHYWIQPAQQRGTLAPSQKQTDPVLGRQDSVEAIIRFALTTVGRRGIQDEDGSIPWDPAKFFQNSRGLSEYNCESMASRADSNDLSDVGDSQMSTLNVSSAGRRYSKQTRSDNSLVWRADRVLFARPIAVVTIRHTGRIRAAECPGVFDANTLGQWALIPECYRAYWSFDQVYSELPAAPNTRISSAALYDELVSYMNNNAVPERMYRALHRLHFKIALLTDDMDRVHASAQASVAGLCRDNSITTYECLRELVSIGGTLAEYCPQQASEWLRPLVEQTVRHTGPRTLGVLDKLMLNIEANNWFLSAKLLLEELGRQGLMQQGAISARSAKLEAVRTARDRGLPDPCELTATVGRYVSQLDAYPRRGPIDMNNVRHILGKGLRKYYADDTSPSISHLVDNVVHLIRLVVGEGPFCGDPAELTRSVERFAALYLAVAKATEPIDTVLATFLALSFCDISTPEDRETLFSQFREHCGAVQAQVNAMLKDRTLDSLVACEDVQGVFDRYERIFRRHLDDPLWPAFKFPFTTNERARLAGKMKLRLMQLVPFLDDLSLKLKYGGPSLELKEKTVYEVSRAAQELLWQAAFLRNPPYPGVVCQYRGGYGLTAVIRGPLYGEDDAPKDKFKAMKYFHLGHRLEDVVLRERELAKSAMDRSTDDDTKATEEN